MGQPRQDLFTAFHKGIRNIIYTASSKLQSADFTSKIEEKALLDYLKTHLQMLEEHGVHQDKNIFSRAEY